MMHSIFSIFFAIIGLGFVIFIHELGHYFMAKRVGMKVEVFSIGFGRPIFSWYRKEIRWQIGWLPFGGYVRIAGMQKEKEKEPHEIEGGFFNKRPIERIKVAFMGPFVNFLLAFCFFLLIWVSGGREKSFSYFTHYIGWVDPDSGFYQEGLRPGDYLQEFNKKRFDDVSELIYQIALKEAYYEASGQAIDYYAKEKHPFSYRVPKTKEMIDFSLANFLIYYQDINKDLSLTKISPMARSGIEDLDRIFWIGGELVFSFRQLQEIINTPHAFLTILREGKLLQTRVPRILSSSKKSHGIEDGYWIPYDLDEEGKVIGGIEKKQEDVPFHITLIKGDRIVAIDGKKIERGKREIFELLQIQRLLIVVQREEKPLSLLNWKEADGFFEHSFPIDDLLNITSLIGSENASFSSGSLRLLSPIVPKTVKELSQINPEDMWGLQVKELEKRLEKTKNSQEKEQLLQQIERENHRFVLGIVLQDRTVSYNPSPFFLFGNGFRMTWQTLISLIRGSLHPKWLTGPIGMVRVMQYSFMIGFKEALFWLAIISLNLGFVNLLPLPVLDGGHILLSLIEMVTKRPIKAKTMDRFIFPFVILLILLFLFVTYQDLKRLFERFFH